MPPEYLHRRRDFQDLIRIVAADMEIDPALVEKDYWIMHSLPEARARAYADVVSVFYIIVLAHQNDHSRRIEELRRLKGDTRREFASVTRQAVQQSINDMINDFNKAA